jgi:peptidoglycan/LPS O-acetylase OafA/YrhL
MHSTHINTTPAPRAIDNTDWLKVIAIILVSVDHFGYFFMTDDQWWSTIGRLAAPVFFFLLGFGQSRKVPFNWIWLGVILTLLDSWNADWTRLSPNILLSLALIRLARPTVQTQLQRNGWPAFLLIVSVLILALPIAGKLVEYGSEGWLWALFGLCQRMYVDSRSDARAAGTAEHPAPKTGNLALMRQLACLTAAVIYVWQEQIEFSFSQLYLIAFILGTGLLSLGLYLFRRGPSRIQPPGPIASVMRFIGRHTLEIYAIQLAGFELIVKFIPGLAA